MRYAILISIAAGCGSSGSTGGDPKAFIGVYATTTHTQAQSPGSTVACTAAGTPVTNGKPFFKLAVDTFFMDPMILRLSGCDDSAGTACIDTLTSMRSGGPGLEDESANSQTGGGLPCQLHYEHATATLTGTAIQLVIDTKYEYASTVPGAQCTYEKALALGMSPDCLTVERWAGTLR